ncbi:unnamed protein product [Candidula unifasciata]|uniref:Transmembrane protein 151B n=1 Tax=Candidula unifasciata TaxID=100452 RepID=A0A8S3ZHP9_9EUPU|nr:unnamed protein product [Candidula unifasciata]
MIDSQTPARQTFCGSLRREGHWKCLSLTLMIVGCLTAISWCHLPLPGKSSRVQLTQGWSPVRFVAIPYIPVACVVMLYLVYLVECWHSCCWSLIVAVMRAALPVIWWKATCYHYVRRTRQVMRYRNGDAFTSTQVYYERVDSSTAGAAFNFTQCGVRDISRPLADLDLYPAVRIRISKGFSFANVDTECQFEEQRAQFFQEYDTKDDYMEGREGMDLMNVDFKEYMIAFRDPTHLPWYVSRVAFWLASVFLLSWPLRTITELKTAHLHYHVHKLFGSNYVEGEDYNGLMSRASTMNSTEFEISIRNNNVIVPSYSEAVLADGQEPIQQKHYGAIKTYTTKFPRSLTNVTLAARPSSAGRRSLTPSVMMDRVKKFKSCSAFGITESTDTCTHQGSVRQQIQQLLRDRGRFQSKRKTTSQFNISSLSLANGNVRFHLGTPGTPEDFVVSPSFSSYSVVSSRINDIRHGVLENDNETNLQSVLQCEHQVKQNDHQMRPTQLVSTHPLPLDINHSTQLVSRHPLPLDINHSTQLVSRHPLPLDINHSTQLVSNNPSPLDINHFAQLVSRHPLPLDINHFAQLVSNHPPPLNINHSHKTGL